MKLFAATLGAMLLSASAHAAVIDFESLSSPTDTSISTYTEDGFDFVSSDAAGFGTWGTTSFNNTGSTTLYNASLTGADTTMTTTTGDAFTARRITLSELFFFSPTSDVTFTGVTSTGAIVTQTFSLDGIFGGETFTFSSAFTDLVSLTWDQQTAYHQFDDILATVDPIPLPAGGVLLLSGLGAFAVLRRRKKST